MPKRLTVLARQLGSGPIMAAYRIEGNPRGPGSWEWDRKAWMAVIKLAVQQLYDMGPFTRTRDDALSEVMEAALSGIAEYGEVKNAAAVIAYDGHFGEVMRYIPSQFPGRSPTTRMRKKFRMISRAAAELAPRNRPPAGLPPA